MYRSNHPEVFVDAHKYLDKALGGFNTIVLLFSSLTMAWGVRCAQLGQRRGLVLCLTATLACASLFLGIKAVEYTHKWDLGLYWGKAFSPLAADAPHGEQGHSLWLLYLCVPAALAFLGFGAKALVSRSRRPNAVDRGGVLPGADGVGVFRRHRGRQSRSHRSPRRSCPRKTPRNMRPRINPSTPQQNHRPSS